MFERDHFLIDGKRAIAESAGSLGVICPSTEESIGSVPKASSADMDRAVAAARRAFDEGPWPRMTLPDRTAVLLEAYRALLPRIEEISLLTTAEMGVPISIATKGFIPRALGIIPKATELAAAVSFEERRPGDISSALIFREPVGVTAAIAPWNAPFMNAVGKLVPALLMGCTVVYKPAPETPLDAYIFVEALYDAGLPAGAVNLVPGGTDVGQHLVSHAGVDKVSFTGSSAAGRWIGGICGTQLKRATLELGGKSAAIILEDADLSLAADVLRTAAFGNSGQVCASYSRVLVPLSLYQQVIELVVDRAGSHIVGDPFNPDTTLGPLVARRQRDRVETYIAAGVEEGARLIAGGGRPAGLSRGWFVEPTVFVDVDNHMQISREEIFGPVVSITPYRSVAEAIAIANDSAYGLHGGVFSSNPEQALAVARSIRTGTFTVNGYLVNFDAPFGGVKGSGIGREFSTEGLLSFTEQKTVNFPLGLPR